MKKNNTVVVTAQIRAFESKTSAGGTEIRLGIGDINLRPNSVTNEVLEEGCWRMSGSGKSWETKYIYDVEISFNDYGRASVVALEMKEEASESRGGLKLPGRTSPASQAIPE
jgi:hypothetical protein